MPDFVSNYWSNYVAIGTLVSILVCFVIAFLTSRAKTKPPVDGKVETTGHTWDEDLTELNNPLPRWWLYLFYITCVFGIVYLIMYPGLGRFSGSLNWSSAGQYDTEVATINEIANPLFEGYLAQDIKAVAAIPEAHEMGELYILPTVVNAMDRMQEAHDLSLIWLIMIGWVQVSQSTSRQRFLTVEMR